MIVKLLTEQHLEFLSLKGGCRGSSESTLVKMSNYLKSHAAARLIFFAWFQYPTGLHQYSASADSFIMVTFTATS